MSGVRARCALYGMLLALLPACARGQKREPVAWPLLDQRNCAAELALRAEMEGPGFSALGQAIETAFVALSPHVGGMARVDGALRALLLMPLSVPIGPAWPTRTLRSTDVCSDEQHEAFRPFRISLEPGLLLREHPTGFVRASFRSIFHPEGSFFGFGAGFGAIADWQGSAALGFSSELLLQLGGCCAPLFWQLSIRRDQYPADREREAFVVVFGPTVW